MTDSPTSKTQLQGIKEALDAAATALPVLFTMCSKIGLREGAMAADEILGSIQWAQKELAHMMTADETTPARVPKYTGLRDGYCTLCGGSAWDHACTRPPLKASDQSSTGEST